MHFLVSPRSDDQKEAVMDSLQTGICRCTHGPAMLSQVASADHETYGFDQKKRARLSDVLTVLSSIFLVETKTKWNLYNPLRLNRRQNWPISLEEFIPGDPATALPNLTDWMGVLINDLDTFEPLFSYFILLSRSLRPYGVVGWLKSPAIWSMISRSVARYSPRSIPVFAEATDKEETVRDFVTTSMLLQCTHTNMSDDELMIWVTRHPDLTFDQIVDTLVLGLRHFSEFHVEVGESTMQAGNDWAWVLCRVLSCAPTAMPHNILPAARDLTTRLIREQSQFEHKLWCLSFDNAWPSRCSGPSCMNTQFTPGVHFRLCGGCRSSGYCTRRCQIRAWSHPQAPHRELCDMFSTYHQVRKRENVQGRDNLPKIFLRFPTPKLEAACTNMEKLRATQLARLGGSFLHSVKLQTLILLQKRCLARSREETIYTLVLINGTTGLAGAWVNVLAYLDPCFSLLPVFVQCFRYRLVEHLDLDDGHLYELHDLLR
jgi:hypothetical protein